MKTSSTTSSGGQFNPAVGWILVAVLLVAAAAGLWLRDARKRRQGLETAPRSLTLLKIILIAVAGVGLVAICNVNRAHSGAIEEFPTSSRSRAHRARWSLDGLAAADPLRPLYLRHRRAPQAEAASAGRGRRGVGPNLGLRTVCLHVGDSPLCWCSCRGRCRSPPTSIKTANSYVLLAVAAAVIGGTSLFGGRGKPIHGVLGGPGHRRHLQRSLPAPGAEPVDRCRRRGRAHRRGNHRCPVPAGARRRPALTPREYSPRGPGFGSEPACFCGRGRPAPRQS